MKWHTSRPTTLTKNPTGRFERVGSPGPGRIRTVGWAIDSSAPADPVAIRVYVGGPSGSPGAELHKVGVANRRRDDIAGAHPWAGPSHGYDVTVDSKKTGRQRVYVYAMNTGEGSANTLLGSAVVDIIPK